MVSDAALTLPPMAETNLFSPEANATVLNSVSIDANAKNHCVVCDDDSDGFHFGQHTCRACAAFFRRTVSLKLEYTCKHNNNCEIVKNARNMCRSCRYQKCLAKGMLTGAVQHARDGLGKRKEATKRPAPEQKPAQPSTSNHSSTSDYSPEGNANTMWSSPRVILQNHVTPPTSSPGSNGMEYVMSGYPNSHANGSFGGPVVNHFAELRLSNYGMAPSMEMKVLGKMVEGYRNFLSLRKASYALIDVIPRYSNGDPDSIPLSNYATSKQTCRMEASLVMETAMKYFHPFSLLTPADRMKIFDNFYCYFSNSERSYNTYRRFGGLENNDKLIMPDGGYVKLSELERFYESSAKGDPVQLAQIFGSALKYTVNTVVSHMQRMLVDEYEMVAIFGMFMWRDTVPELSQEALNLVHQTRDDILRDLHVHYRSLNLQDVEMSVRLGNLFLLIPKLEQALKMIRENYNIAELFNMIEVDTCCRHFHKSSE